MKRKFVKLPIEIEAMQYDGTNAYEVWNFIDNNKGFVQGLTISIVTLEGTMIANVGDWIIKGINGEFYPCKPDIFEKTYVEVKQ